MAGKQRTQYQQTVQRAWQAETERLEMYSHYLASPFSLPLQRLLGTSLLACVHTAVLHLAWCALLGARLNRPVLLLAWQPLVGLVK